jgi:hypothetical protein
MGSVKRVLFSQMLVRRRKQFSDQALAFLSTLAKPEALRAAPGHRRRQRVGTKSRRVA